MKRMEKKRNSRSQSDKPMDRTLTDAQRANVERIRAAVKRIPRGRVSTYSAIAEVAGLPKRARLVGTVLRETPASSRLPWFRVINASGRSSFPVGSDAYIQQYERLEAEGVEHSRGRIDMARYGWPTERFGKPRSLDEYFWKLD
jgi:methylated-DNA-protein-cysteine methyltransferase-like protein